jgi:hypothetical protein
MGQGVVPAFKTATKDERTEAVGSAQSVHCTDASLAAVGAEAFWRLSELQAEKGVSGFSICSLSNTCTGLGELLGQSPGHKKLILGVRRPACRGSPPQHTFQERNSSSTAAEEHILMRKTPEGRRLPRPTTQLESAAQTTSSPGWLDLQWGFS